MFIFLTSLWTVSSFAMLRIKIKHPLHSVLLLCCMAHAFDNSGVTSDRPATEGLGIGLGQYPDPSKNVGTDTIPWSTPGLPSDGLESRSSEQHPRTTSAPIVDDVENRSSELNDLFAGGNASIDSSSKARLITLEGGSSAKADQRKTDVGIPVGFNLSLNGSQAGTRPMLQINTNKLLIVPSEGGVMQAFTKPTLDIAVSDTTSTTARGGLLEVKSSTDKVEVKDGKNAKVELGVGLGLPTREGVYSQVKNRLNSQDSHISARKGANLLEQLEPANGQINDTTFTSSEIGLPTMHTQKITPRKGAELPKIYPRKGVEPFVIPNSSDQFSSEINNDGVSASKSTYRPTGNPTDIIKHANTNEASTLKNNSRTYMTGEARPSTQSASSSSSIDTNNPMEAVMLKTKFTSGVTVIKSNLTSSITTPMIEVKNNTWDKPNVVDESGIIASYPPLKKRLKPLKTTDTNSLNSSPIAPEHNSSGHDYVIPIVVTILTVPMLVVLVLFLYKKGSEFWERRHYRRMDFLIDGMYND